MNPALSVIFFTVVSGTGFGLISLATLLDSLSRGRMLSTTELLVASVAGIILATAGLLASTLHLANPKNAWRAFFRFRTSWLSREAVFSVLFYPVATFYVAGLWLYGDHRGMLVGAIGVATAALALTTVFCTAMIYASLRTIPQWNSPLVPVNYLLLSLSGGSIALLVVDTSVGADMEQMLIALSLALIAAGAGSKLVYFSWIGKPRGPSINTAIGLTKGRARLLESAQSSSNFTTREFDYRAPLPLLWSLRLVVYALGFVVPALLLVWMWQSETAVTASAALIAALAGLGVERWLFFAEARHTVNLFYGRQRC